MEDKDLNQYFDILSDEKSTLIERKKAIIILAHIGKKKALKLLKWYKNTAKKELLFWLETAIDECQMFNSSK